jgi:hypothetical protein
MEEDIYTNDEEKILEELARNPPTEAEKNEILSNFVKRLPSIPFKKGIKIPLMRTHIESFPKCFLRFSRYYDGMFVMCCGKRSLVDEDFDDLGYTIALAECTKCGGYTSTMMATAKSYLKRSKK